MGPEMAGLADSVNALAERLEDTERSRIQLMTDLAAPTEPLVLLTARGIDTIIGVTAAIVVSMLLPGDRD